MIIIINKMLDFILYFKTREDTRLLAPSGLDATGADELLWRVVSVTYVNDLAGCAPF